MPHIGQRIIKSSIAVFLCFAIYMFRGSGIPFYSAIAAILCMQPELNDSFEKGKSRIIATIIGGISGMIVLYILQTYIHNDWIWYSIISILIIPMLYFTSLARQSASSYLSCVVFMSITVSHSQDEMVLFFAMNRILDTLIGIFVALGVNAIHLPRHKNKEVLIEVPLMFLTSTNGSVDTYSKVHLNRCIDQGAHLLFSSSHTPSGMLQRIQGIHMPISCLLMDGALVFDPQKQTSQGLCALDKHLWKAIYSDFIHEDMYPFTYEVKDQMLYVHGEKFINNTLKELYLKSHRETGKHYVLHEQCLIDVLHHDMISMMLAGDIALMEKTKEILVHYKKQITWVVREMDEHPGKFLLRIYPIALAQMEVLDVLAKQMDLMETQKIRMINTSFTTKQVIKEIEKVFYKKTR